jgi:hypothetical protein
MIQRPRAAIAVAIALASGCSGSAPPRVAVPAPGPAAPALAPVPVPVPVPVPDLRSEQGRERERERERAEAPSADPRPRIASIGAHTWIYRGPEAKGLPLGRIRMGESVALRSTKPIRNESCGRGWYEVEPRGWVCLRTLETTLDMGDPYFGALATSAPARDAVWYYRYAYSNGAPMYSRVPTPTEQEKEDAKYGPRGAYQKLERWARGHEELLLDTGITAEGPVPDVFAGGKRHVGGGTRDTRRLIWRTIPNGSIVAYTRAFAAEGRTWLMTPDLMLVPADRVRDIRRSTFHGVQLGEDTRLPIAWNRAKTPTALYRRQAGKLAAAPDALAPKHWVPVDEAGIVEEGRRYLPVRGEPDTFVAEDDVTISTARAPNALPKGVAPGERWIEVKIVPGTLTAYEGDRPVYATLISPGKGGVPLPGQDHAKFATTALGTFPIEWKDHIDTMSSEPREPTVMWFTDVPHIQYLRAPLAMHVSLWHEDFGNPKSAECINVSPEDGHFLFGWTEPGLPEGWGGIRPGDGNGKSTTVVVTAR